jgi:hypothetical protein
MKARRLATYTGFGVEEAAFNAVIAGFQTAMT